MSDLRKAAEMALEALEWCDPERVEKELIALRQALAQPEQEPLEYKEECWACGCEECICATKVPGYYESKIKEAVLAEREACAKVCDEALLQLNETVNQLENSEYIEQCVVGGAIAQAEKLSKAIRARGEK